jgi:RNA polymerase sigma factor (sigma-70 family)
MEAGKGSSPGIKELLEKTLARLNERQRTLVMLKDYEGYSYEEIAEITGLNATQVKVTLHRARLQLKEWLVSVEHVL